jgi:hypothetical protein
MIDRKTVVTQDGRAIRSCEECGEGFEIGSIRETLCAECAEGSR